MGKSATGKCLCAAVTVTCTLENDKFDACHCGMCRKWSGGPFLTVDDASDIVFTGKEFISAYQSSDWAERGFCKRCGTHLFYRLKGNGMTVLSLGLFDGLAGLKFHKQIFVDKKPDYYAFANNTEQMTEAEVFAKYAP